MTMKTTRKDKVGTKATAPAAKPVKKSAASRKSASKRLVPPPLAAADDDLTHAAIATRAYFIYQSEGCPEGRDVQHWLEAEASHRHS
jgi:hypothetical protein